jgi:hypothetical protein
LLVISRQFGPGELRVLVHYTVRFTNITGCAIGISDISWCVTVRAESEADALEQGLAEAREYNQEFGLPPHGIRVNEEELRRQACVQFMGYA